jgi:hypothetical protein
LTKKSKHERPAASPSPALDAGLARADLLILRLKAAARAADGKRRGPGAQGRLKIKKFWQTIGFYEIGQGDVDWSKLEAVGTVKLEDEHRQFMVGAMNDYTRFIKLHQASPRASDMRRHLEELAAVFKAFRVELSSGAPGRVAAIRHVVMTMAIKDKNYAGYAALEDVLRAANRWENAVAEAMTDPPRDKGGAPGDPFIGSFLVKAYKVYLAAGGKSFTRRFADDATRSEPATAFLQQVCAVAGYHGSQATLRDKLRRALGKNPVKKKRG